MIQKDWLSLNTDVERIILRQQTRVGQYLATSYASMYNCRYLWELFERTYVRKGAFWIIFFRNLMKLYHGTLKKI